MCGKLRIDVALFLWFESLLHRRCQPFSTFRKNETAEVEDKDYDEESDAETMGDIAVVKFLLDN